MVQPSDVRLDQDVKAICPLNAIRYSMNLQATIAFAKARKQRTWIFYLEQIAARVGLMADQMRATSPPEFRAVRDEYAYLAANQVTSRSE